MGDRLRLRADAGAQRVVRAPTRAAPRFAADDFDRSERRLPTDQVFEPATLVDCRIDQFRTGVCL